MADKHVRPVFLTWLGWFCHLLQAEVAEKLTRDRELARLRARVADVALSFERATSDGHALYGSVR